MMPRNARRRKWIVELKGQARVRPAGARAMTQSTFSGQDSGTVPPGTPAWITRELIDKTISVWQRFYSAQLSAADAVEMLISVGNLFAVLRDAAPSKGN